MIITTIITTTIITTIITTTIITTTIATSKCPWSVLSAARRSFPGGPGRAEPPERPSRPFPGGSGLAEPPASGQAYLKEDVAKYNDEEEGY